MKLILLILFDFGAPSFDGDRKSPVIDLGKI